MSGMLVLYPVILLVVMFYGAKVSGKGEFVPEALGLEHSGAIKGAACIGVILHHLTQQVSGYGIYDKGPVTLLNYMGILFTALFFFFSGYGLITSLYNKKDYLATFPGRRFPAVLIPFWTINVLGVLLRWSIYSLKTGWKEIVSDILGFTLINSNGWFIIEIVILYLLFYIIFSVVKNKDAGLILLILGVFVLIFYSSGTGHDPEGNKSHWFRGEWWYNSTITFAFGLVYARFKEKFRGFCRKSYRIVLPLTALLFVVSFYVSIYTVRRFGYYHSHLYSGRRDEIITLLSQMAVCIIFTLLVLLLSEKITLGNRALIFLRKISLVLLLIHGFFVETIFGKIRMPDFARFGAVLFCSIACAALVSPGIRFLVNRTISVTGRKRIVNDTLEGAAAKRRSEKRKRLLLRLAALACAALAAGLLFLPAGRTILEKKEFEEEYETLRTASAGDIVTFGRFETDGIWPFKERLAWRVLKREKDSFCLVSLEGLAGHSYNRKHMEVSWEESDLFALLAGSEFTDMFSRFELSCVVPEEGCLLTLMTREEAEELFASDKDRELAITKEAAASGTNINLMSKADNWDMKGYRSSWWWLRGEKGRRDVMAPIVTVDGEISQKEVNRPDGAVRPMIRVRLADG